MKKGAIALSYIAFVENNIKKFLLNRYFELKIRLNVKLHMIDIFRRKGIGTFLLGKFGEKCGSSEYFLFRILRKL